MTRTYTRRTAAVLLVLALSACGEGGPTEPPVEPVDGVLSMSIIEGQGQIGYVETTLPDPLGVQVVQNELTGALRMVGPQASLMANEDPVPGVVVNFVVVEEGCGRPFAGSAVTDTIGRAKDLWELGGRAGECRMEARAVDPETGAPMVFDTFFATALPGAPETFDFPARVDVVAGTDPSTLASLVTNVRDEHGNALDSFTVSIDAGTLDVATEDTGRIVVTVGSVQRQVPASSYRDLSAITFDVAYRCFDAVRASAADSIYVTGTVTVEYWASPSPSALPDRDIKFVQNLTALTWEAGDTATIPFESHELESGRQLVPDRLSSAGHVLEWLEAEQAYVSSGPLCNGSYRQGDVFRLAARP
ncbi:MAG TPA: hypothetical protein VD838_21265 [Anaeromyxobacteraceae bacterium]|nr:hypothetical protein [Anaeromyxobacteraceae bacterium]